jgi:hypothetical protein
VQRTSASFARGGANDVSRLLSFGDEKNHCPPGAICVGDGGTAHPYSDGKGAHNREIRVWHGATENGP